MCASQHVSEQMMMPDITSAPTAQKLQKSSNTLAFIKSEVSPRGRHWPRTRLPSLSLAFLACPAGSAPDKQYWGHTLPLARALPS